LLNRSIRALAQAVSATEWKEILLDCAAHFSERAILLRAGSQEFVLEGSRGIEEQPRLTILHAAAPAIEEAIRSGETIVAACEASELSGPIARMMEGARLVHAVPVVQKEGAVAVLLTSGSGDPAAIELLATAASLALRRGSASTVNLVPLAAIADNPAPKPNPMELRARQFSRVAVARMVLRHSSAVAAGRRGRNLYSALAPLVDAAREQYSARYLSGGARMADYLHEEFVRSVARNDENILGAEYPGPLA
jgi:putative intracellular protease/amidase